MSASLQKHIKALTERCAAKSTAAYQLQNVSWLLNVEVSNINRARILQPSCDLELAFSNSEKVTTELSHDDISKLFRELETIQHQIDTL